MKTTKTRKSAIDTILFIGSALIRFIIKFFKPAIDTKKELETRKAMKEERKKNHKAVKNYYNGLKKGFFSSQSGINYKVNNTLDKETNRKKLKSFLHISEENKKIKWTDTQAFLIFSIIPLLTCPGATSGCIKNCYALNNYYPDTIKCRVENYLLTRNPLFVSIVSEYLKDYLKKHSRKLKGKKLAFRIHEAGDFYSTEYMLKWFEIARMFPEITFYAYTKSFSIMDKCYEMKPDNFVLRSSLWQYSTTREELVIVEKYDTPIYTAFDAEEMPKGIITCPCSAGCGSCGNLCGQSKKQLIACEIH